MAVIGKYVKARRLELGLTQEELAHKMGYKTKSSINKIELGAQDVPLAKVEELAKCLDCAPDYLMGWKNDSYSALIEMAGKMDATQLARLLAYAQGLTDMMGDKDEGI